MSKFLKLSIMALTMLTMWACVDNTANKPVNTNANANTNASTVTKAAPTADTLLALDKQANEAYFKGDATFFEGFLSDKFVMNNEGARITKAMATKMIAGVKCDIKEGGNILEPQVAMIDADTYVFSYKATFEGTCTENGTTTKYPSPVRAATIFVRNGDKWQAVFHGENAIADPKSVPPPSAKPETKTESKPMANANSSNSNSNSTAAAPAAPMPDPNTDALTKLHNSGWEAWKAKDAAKLGDMTTANLTFVDPMGGWHGSKVDIIKFWTQDMKCEGVNTAKFGDGFATALSPTVEILTGKGTADGTCDGQKNGDLYTTAVYVKEGDTWKLAFMMESLPHA